MRASYLSLQPFVLARRPGVPLAWELEFGRVAPLQLEVGFGNGEYLARVAGERPDWNFVGIEDHWDSLRRALRRLARRGVTNVRLVQEDARVALKWLFAPRSLDRIVSLFPCPWRKERTARHRLFTTAFLRLAARRLRDGGQLTIVTDYRPLLDWCLEQVPGSGLCARWEAVPPRFDTKYERKWFARGQSQFYELALEKTQHPDVASAEEAGESGEAGEYAVKTLWVESFDAGGFAPPALRGEITVEPKSFLYDPQRETGMLRVIVVEDNLTQNFWIRIARDGERWRIQPAAGCGYLPTLGVQRALELVHDAALRQAGGRP